MSGHELALSVCVCVCAIRQDGLPVFDWGGATRKIFFPKYKPSSSFSRKQIFSFPPFLKPFFGQFTPSHNDTRKDDANQPEDDDDSFRFQSIQNIYFWCGAL